MTKLQQVWSYIRIITNYLKKTITKEKDSVIQDATVIKSASSSSMEGVVSND